MKHGLPIEPDYVQLARSGDERAIEELYLKYAKAMYNISLRLCADPELAKDIFQDAFIKAMQGLKQLKNNGSFGAWMKKIVINETLRQLKKSELHLVCTDNIPEWPQENDEGIYEWDLQRLNQEILSLPEGCRQVFVLYAIEDYSHQEVARQLIISESTSKSQYQRARKILQQKLLKSING